MENEDEAFSDFSIDFGEFVVLEMLRLCRVDQDDLKAIRSLFDDIDYNNTGEIDHKKLQRFSELLHSKNEIEKEKDNKKEKRNRTSREEAKETKKSLLRRGTDARYSDIDIDIEYPICTSNTTSIPENCIEVIESPQAVKEYSYQKESSLPANYRTVEAEANARIKKERISYVEIDANHEEGDKDDSHNLKKECDNTHDDNGDGINDNKSNSNLSCGIAPLSAGNDDNYMSKMSIDTESCGSLDSQSEGGHYRISDDYNRLLMPILHMRNRSNSHTAHSAIRRRKDGSNDRKFVKDGDGLQSGERDGYGRLTPEVSPGRRSTRGDSVTSDASDDGSFSPTDHWFRQKGSGSVSKMEGRAEDLEGRYDFGDRDVEGTLIGGRITNDYNAYDRDESSGNGNDNDEQSSTSSLMLRSFGYSKYGAMKTITEETT